MKKLLAIVVLVATGLVHADYQVRTYNGDYTVRTNHSKLYVCYKSRIIDNNTGDLIYLGCGRYRNSCYSNHRVHFGKYPSNSAARRALRRCQYSNPRFVD